MPSVRTWVLAIRPRTLPAAAVPVAVGTALAVRTGVFAPGPALAALAGALALQIGCNLANDYFDWQKGADGPDRLGPTRVTSAGLATPGQVRAATAIAFAAALAAGVYLVAVAGWPIAALGVAAILAAIGYTAGPYPLGYNGLGEVAAFAFFGPVAVAGTYFVQAGSVHPLAWVLAAPVGAWVAAIMVVNNLRDAPTDARVGKRTLAVRFGQGFARGLYAALVAVGFLAPLALAATGLGWAGVLPLLALPLAIAPLRAVFGPPEGPALNAALAATARVLLAGGGLLAAGLVLC